jgi:hypothetical protein
LKGIDEPDRLETVGVSSNLWLLSIEFVHLCRYEVIRGSFSDAIILCDQEGYQFPCVKDLHLCFRSRYAKTYGLGTLYGVQGSGVRELPPKIPRKCAIAYELPDFFENLLLAVRNGTISEA